MNLDELQSVRDRERQTDKPQQLRETFYEDIGAFVEQLRAERERAVERHGSHYADEVMQITDEIETTRTLVEKLHERRIGKIVKAASLEAADLSPEVGGLTVEEQDLFETLVADIEAHREGLLATLDGDDSGESATAGREDPTPAGAERAPTPDSGQPSGETAIPDSGQPNGGTATPDSGQSNGDATTAAEVMGSQGGDGQRSTDPENEREHPKSGGRRGDAATVTGAGDDERGPDGIESNGRGPETGNSSDSGVGPGDDSGVGPGDDSGVGPGDATAGGVPDGPGSNGHRPDTGASPESRSDGGRDDPGADVERERVLVTEDIDTFVGRDARDYDLAADDVVTLPATNADLLVERDAAQRL